MIVRIKQIVHSGSLFKRYTEILCNKLATLLLFSRFEIIKIIEITFQLTKPLLDIDV